MMDEEAKGNNAKLMERVCELLHREEELLARFAHNHAAKYVDGVLTDECKYCGMDIRDAIHHGPFVEEANRRRAGKEGG